MRHTNNGAPGAILQVSRHGNVRGVCGLEADP
jgi:hypothetical protein